MRAKYSLRVITQASYSRGMSVLPVATLAVLIDPIMRLSDYRVLQHLLPVAGTRKFSGILTLVFLQVVALFYLIFFSSLEFSARRPSFFLFSLSSLQKVILKR